MEPPLTGVDMQVLAVPAEILTAGQQLPGLPAKCAGPLTDPQPVGVSLPDTVQFLLAAAVHVAGVQPVCQRVRLLAGPVGLAVGDVEGREGPQHNDDFNDSNKAKCLLDAVETPLSLLHCHTLYLKSSRMFQCNKECIYRV